MKMAVLGAGSWGTAFSGHLAKCSHQVLLWGRNEKFMEKLSQERKNQKYLPQIKIPEQVEFTPDLERLEEFGEVVFIAVPSEAVEQVMKKVKRALSPERLKGITWVSLTKGIKFGEGDHLLTLITTMTDIIRDVIGVDKRILVLSGPSHAEEVGREIPTSVILTGLRTAPAGRKSSYEKAKLLRGEISNSYFRVYTRTTPQAVEVCAGVKNPIAIGAGIARGLGKYGDNTLASLVSRGTKEIADLVGALGLNREPVYGLAGNGDLIATCNSEHSRNQRYGFAIGGGKRVKPGTIDGMVVEGYYAAKQIELIKRDLGIEMPICEQVYQVLYNDKNPRMAIEELMRRDYKEERIL